MFRKLAAAALVVALSACASTPASEGARLRDCFRTLDVRGYGVLDEHSIRVHISPAREYILTIPANTRELDWNHAISIRSVTSFICVGDPENVQLMGGDPPFPYQVIAIERAPQDAPTGS